MSFISSPKRVFSLLQMTVIASSLVLLVQSTATVDTVVGMAVDQINMEDTILAQRLTDGIDKKVSDFPKVVPLIMGAGRSPPMSPLESIASNSRAINWIKAIANAEGVNAPIDDFLASSTGIAEGFVCPFSPTACVGTFRTISGTCNNAANPNWGAGFTPFVREIPSNYDSGMVDSVTRDDLPRQTGASGALPSARTVSNIVHQSSSNPRPAAVTMEYTNYGQFVAHDLTDTPMENGAEGAKMKCCDTTLLTRRCAGIPVPPSGFFGQLGRTCLQFARSIEVTDINCENGIREQLNVASAYLDGTGIYGHTDAELDILRSGTNGLLTTSAPNHLPHAMHPNPKAFETGFSLFKAGDEKVSEFTGLIAVTQVWQREHNRIAQTLSQFARFTSIADTAVRDNDIFQEARKLVIALIQHVTYREYIPITVGTAIMSKYDLKLLSNGVYTGYDNTVNPAITNVFATAAFRFGHSMLRDVYTIVRKNLTPTGETLRLKKILFRSNFYLLFENGFQRGEFVDLSEKCDRFITDDVRNHLFETEDGNGNDLAALNIQRGRDHGLDSYNGYRVAVGLTASTEFTNGASGFVDMQANTVSKLNNAYDDPEDVDVWTGGVSEQRVPGGQVGPLFAELIGQQFEKIKVGDRFWYERAGEFTSAQLAQIRKATFAKILCNNVNGITKIQPKVFKKANTGGNAVGRCNALDDVDLTEWE